MPDLTRFAPDDTVTHPARPEWGTGKVRRIQAIAQPGGERAQRVTVDFPNRGRVVINTAVVALRPGEKSAPRPAPPRSPATRPSMPLTTAAGPSPASPRRKPMPHGSNSSDSGWLAALDKSSANSHELWDLPDDLTNPFASLADRLKATLQTYKFSTEPRALMDWAVGQTGLDDPLSKYTRHELEQAFPRFARDRDQHLRDLVRQLKRNDDRATLKDCGRGLFPAAQSALDKAIRN